MKSRIYNILSNPKLSVALVLIAAVLYGVFLITGDHEYGGYFRYNSDNVNGMYFNGGYCLLTDVYGNVVKYNTESEEIICIIEPRDYGNEYTFLNEAAISESGDIYLMVCETDETDYITAEERIIRFDGSGRKISDMCRYDYSSAADPPHRSARLSSLDYSGDMLRFAYTDEYKTEFLEIDVNTGVQTSVECIPRDENGVFVSEVISLKKDHLVIMSDGNVYSTANIGELLYSCSFDGDFPDEQNYIRTAAETDSAVFAVIGNYRRDEVYRIKDDKTELVFSLRDCLTDNTKEYDLFWNSDMYIYKLFAHNDNVYICTTDGITFCLDENGNVSQWKIDLRLPFINTVKAIINDYFGITAAVFIVLAFVCAVIMIILRKKSILVKQLLMILPAAAVMTSVIIVISIDSTEKNYFEQLKKEMAGLSETCALVLSENDLDLISDLRDFDSGIYCDLTETLKMISGSNKGYWNKNFDFTVYTVFKDNIAYRIAGTDYLSVPFGAVAYYEFLPEFLLSENSSVYFFESTGGDGTKYYTTVSPIYSKDGFLTGYLDISTDLGTFYSDVKKMQFKILAGTFISFILLIIIITAISAYISGTIKKATLAVSKIASGDFSARVTKNADDELGEICRGVNDMAYRLEELFTEKDDTEKFYYKFVPEKFKELLGKEKITDLSLGDALSKELTVLFCDIRSFSINSEIMTAKENFEFVNVIYGKAGPLVRKYGGFVDKYIGDAVMALFENADDAVKCGTELYHSIVLDPNTAESLNVSDINIGIGIHTGMARIGIVGESERLSGTVISDTVNLSSRLESLTKMYHTAMLVSKDTVDRMTETDSFDLRYLGMVQVAGVNEVKAVYEVLDCLPDDIHRSRHENSKSLREAIRLFHLGRRKEAAEALEIISAENIKNDEVIKMYLDYISNMSDDDKGNVFRFVRK